MSYKYIVTFEVCAVFLVVHTPRRLPAAVCYRNLQQTLCIPFVPDRSPRILGADSLWAAISVMYKCSRTSTAMTSTVVKEKSDS